MGHSLSAFNRVCERGKSGKKNWRQSKRLELNNNWDHRTQSEISRLCVVSCELWLWCAGRQWDITARVRIKMFFFCYPNSSALIAPRLNDGKERRLNLNDVRLYKDTVLRHRYPPCGMRLSPRPYRVDITQCTIRLHNWYRIEHIFFNRHFRRMLLVT